jgi:hypothetical protein
MESLLRSSVVHPLGKVNTQFMVSPTAEETTEFCRGLFFACIFQLMAIAGGVVLWRISIL